MSELTKSKGKDDKEAKGLRKITKKLEKVANATDIEKLAPKAAGHGGGEEKKDDHGGDKKDDGHGEKKDDHGGGHGDDHGHDKPMTPKE